MARRRELWQAELGLLAVIWGFSFVLIKVGDSSLAPVQVALGRMAVGAATLLVLVAIRRERLPRDPRVWAHLAAAALLLNAAPFTLFAYGELGVSSVVAGIWNATAPLWTLLVAMAVLPDERPTPPRLAGLGIGFAGVLVVLGAWRGVGGALAGNALCMAAACCYGLGFPYVRRHLGGRPESALSLSAAQLVCGTAELALVTPFVTHAPASLPPPDVVAAVLALGAFGTGVAYVLNYGIVRAAGATVASTVTYLVPVCSTVAGVVVLHEPLTWNQPAGAAIVLLGAAAAQLPRAPSRWSEGRTGRRSS